MIFILILRGPKRKAKAGSVFVEQVDKETKIEDIREINLS